MPNRVLVSLGSNIDKEKNLPAAVQKLSDMCHLVAVSSAYETAPVGLEDQPAFLNAAALVETDLEAAQFREEILAKIERDLKRIRTLEKNAPRTIDADITLFNQLVFDLDPDHHVPDPDLLQLPHVAVPVAELVPELLHPETGECMKNLASRLVRETTRDGVPPLWKRPDIALGALSHESD